MPDELLMHICGELVAQGAHTVLLYGSRADGTSSASSDYDVAGFAPVGQPRRDTRIVDGHFLDVFMHPDELLARPVSPELLPLRGSRILRQRNGDATRLLAALEDLYRRGPERLAPDEIRARDAWARKMALRARRGDVEGDYRRVWLLTALLEDYFVTRGRWFEGPKKALADLRLREPTLYEVFGAALKVGAGLDSIDRVVALATDRLPARDA